MLKRQSMRSLGIAVAAVLFVASLGLSRWFKRREAVLLANRVALLLDGELMQYGEPSTFYERPSSVAVADAVEGARFTEGDPVCLHFPLERLWLLPATERTL